MSKRNDYSKKNLTSDFGIMAPLVFAMMKLKFDFAVLMSLPTVIVVAAVVVLVIQVLVMCIIS